MSLARADRLTLALDNACKLFADSATFRTLMEVNTPALAYAKCWLWETDDANSAIQSAFPRTVFSHSPGSVKFRKISTTTGLWEGSIDVSIEIPTPAEYLDSEQDAYTYINNKAGAILSEIFTLSTNGSEATLNTGKAHLALTGYDVDAAGIIDPTKINGERRLGAELVIHWRGD